MQGQEKYGEIHYRFIKQVKVKYGEAVFVSGSTVSLGNWNPLKAVRLSCKQQKYWWTEVLIPLEEKVEFKYFIAPFNFGEGNKGEKEVTWIGEKNSSMKVPKKHRAKFEKDDLKSFTVMSFNIRYENKDDKGEYSWQNRKEKCSSVMLEHLPDVIGVQEPKNNQIKFLKEKTCQFYDYFGKPRDLKEDQHSGIFIRKDKFFVKEDGQIWINETKTPGKKGFGASLPRYFTFLVLEEIGRQNSLMMVINTHLDHQNGFARLWGVKIIQKLMEDKLGKYGEKLRNVFLSGDFNTSDTDPIFDELNLDSLRYVVEKKNSDFDSTFNGFKNFITTMLSELLREKLVIIDHIFVKLTDFAPVQLKVLRNEIVSDHFPIIGSFKVQE